MKALGIINFSGNHIHVDGMQDYRPIGAFSFLGRYRVIDFPISTRNLVLSQNISEPVAITISIPNEENYSFSFPKNRLRIRCMIQILLHTWRTWSVLNTLPVLT